ncbi:hypothetical protein ACFLYJ_02260 [Candidatus Cloacimonadota bacterium]
MSLANDYQLLLNDFGLKQVESESDVIAIDQKLSSKAKEKLKKTIEHFYAQNNLNLEKSIDEMYNEYKSSVSDHGYYTGSEVKLVLDACKELGYKFDKNIFFGDFPTGDFNANVRPTQNGYLCLINNGLKRLLYNLPYAWFSAFNQKTLSKSFLTPQNKDKNKLYKAFAKTIWSINEYHISNKHTNAFDFDSEYDTMCFINVNNLNLALKSFVVAHEVGHVISGHLDKSTLHAITYGNRSFHTLKRSHEQEYEADMIAQVILREIEKKNGFGSSNFLVAGSIFMLCDLMTKKVRLKLLGIEDKISFSDTHPPSHDRLVLLLNELLNGVKDMNKLSNCLRILFFVCQFLIILDFVESEYDYNKSSYITTFKIPQNYNVMKDIEQFLKISLKNINIFI